MCGYLGAVNFESGIQNIYPELQRGLKAIAHRGPDGSKELVRENAFLGHNRLSIIDLSPLGDQPMKSANAEAFILFNGMIFNYKELKNDLGNINFRSTSDTEVILEGYLIEGTNFFKKLKGIYSFAIFDYRDNLKVVLCRDPSGIKPLYFYKKKQLYVFGSEMKALMPAVRNDLTINEKVLKCYLNLGYCPEPQTIYNEINTIKPGTAVEINENEVTFRNLIDFDFESENDFDFDKNKEITREKLRNAVRRNLVSDVEVAVALSGGIDSSLIYSYACGENNLIRGLTVAFDDKEHSEEEIAKVYSSTVSGRHELVRADSELNLEMLNKIISDFDQPYADSSAINVFYLTRATSKITKVLLGGDGGDELFNGYPSMTWLTYIDKFNRSKFTKKSGDALLDVARMIPGNSRKRLFKRISDLWNDEPAEMLYDWHSWFPRKTCFDKKSPFLFDTNDGLNYYKSIFENDAPSQFRHFVVFDYFRKTMLSDYLRKTDMMSALNGVEYRVPFLDEDMVSFAMTIPFGQKSTLKVTKKILRSIHQEKFPAHTSKIAKKGFTIPLDKSLSQPEFDLIKDSILQKGNIISEYVSGEYVKFLFDTLNGKNASEEISRAGVYQRILMLYSLSLWNDIR